MKKIAMGASETNNEIDSFVASQVDVAEDYPVSSKAKDKQLGSGKRLQGAVELPAVGKSNNNRGNRQAAATISPPPLIKVNDNPTGPHHQVTVKTKLNKFVKERSPPPPHLQHRQEQQSKATSGSSLI